MTAITEKEVGKNCEATIDDQLGSPHSPEDGEVTDQTEETPTTVPTPPAKRRKCGRESLAEQALDGVIPKNVLIRSSNIIWVDLEMTGLDQEKDHIMEMACIVTDKHLNILAEGPNLVIHQSDEVLEGMGDWCTIQHGKTGLTQQCRDSKLTCAEVEQQMIDFISQYCPKGRCELAGNSIHTDRRFIEKEMPKFLEWLHYRIIDVSTVRNIAWRWYPQFEKYYSNQPISHRALDDIRSSIEELKYYRETVFKSQAQYREQLEKPPPQDALEVLMTRYEAIQARKISQRSKSESEATDEVPEDQHNKATQPPVNVSVNGKNITLFGNQM
ncbi:hypothetical protein ACHWQZ_G018034 [Mnemiopsis leidyi]